MAYADDILITARTTQSLTNGHIPTIKELLIGSRINHKREEKTKYLKCTRKYIKRENININSSYIEQVKQYKYLGSIITTLTPSKKRLRRG